MGAYSQQCGFGIDIIDIGFLLSFCVISCYWIQMQTFGLIAIQPKNEKTDSAPTYSMHSGFLKNPT